ncbi:MAG: hypothetical protein HY669_03600 [Chloroflexi bacterium]|nr:hypothetical protein [Chloroflexota bacterium]
MKARLAISVILAMVLLVGVAPLVRAADWTPITPPDSPAARQGPSMVTLPDGRVMLFGGSDTQGAWFNDLHVFTADTWSQVTPTNGPPSARANHNAWVRNDKMYVSGGNGPQGPRHDTWYYDLQSNDWHEVNVSGPRPSARYGHTSTPLPDGRTLIVGGTDATGTVLRDAWYLNADGTYTRMEDTVYPVTNHSAYLSADRDKLLIFGLPYKVMYFDFSSNMWDYVSGGPPLSGRAATATAGNTAFFFGGNDANGNVSDIVYEVNLSAFSWRQRAEHMPYPVADGAAAPLPASQSGQAMSNSLNSPLPLAAASKEKPPILLFGGLSNGIATNATSLFSPEPSARIDYAMAYFPPDNGIIMHGGWGDPDWQPLNEMWKLDASGWSALEAPDSPAFAHHSMTYDSGRGVLVLSGRHFDGTYQVWEYDGNGWVDKGDVPLGPSIDGDVEVAYDANLQRVVLYAAGFDGVSVETWEYDEIDWVQKVPQHQPPAVADGALLQYDGTAQKTMLVAPIGDLWQEHEAQTWLWDGIDWSEVGGTQPPNAGGGGMAYDSARGEMVLITSQMDTWTFDGTGWTQIFPRTSPVPVPSRFFAMAFDPVQQIAAFFSGESVDAEGNYTYPDTTWLWDGTNWSELSAPPAQEGDVNGDGMVDMLDLAAVAAAFNTSPPSNPAADVNNDGMVNIFDLALVSVNFGRRSQ